MIHEDAKFTRPENVGSMESIVRGSASMALLVVAMLIPAIGSYLLFALTQVAIYLGLTAFIGWDPIYAMLKQPSSGVPAQSPATVVAQERQQSQVSGGDHKKAA
ncbi:MAG: DUF2892 domain-containing protein [Gammaproteobacteria bacterium]